jgi:predicted transposase YbfD/YdcC
MAAGGVHVAFEEVLAHFGTLVDPRSTVNRRHPLSVVVTLAVLAVLAGKARGIDQPILAVDGKTLRRSHDHAHALGALHSVSVWASEFGLSLGQVAGAEKSHEITAIPEVLRLADINGAIITIDALGTPKAIAAQIHENGGGTVLAVKGNQGNLEAAVIDTFIEETENDFASGTVAIHETTERAHGRTTTRTYHQMAVPDGLPTKDLWPGLATIGKVISTCLRGGVESVEIR